MSVMHSVVLHIALICDVRETIEKLVVLGGQPTSEDWGVTQYGRAATLFLITYIFLLRLPSEALPLTVGAESSTNTIFVQDSQLVLTLGRRCLVPVLLYASLWAHVRILCRKNKANGSRLTRKCWCASSAVPPI